MARPARADMPGRGGTLDRPETEPYTFTWIGERSPTAPTAARPRTGRAVASPCHAPVHGTETARRALKGEHYVRHTADRPGLRPPGGTAAAALGAHSVRAARREPGRRGDRDAGRGPRGAGRHRAARAVRLDDGVRGRLRGTGRVRALVEQLVLRPRHRLRDRREGADDQLHRQLLPRWQRPSRAEGDQQ